MILIDGKKIATEILAQLKQEVTALPFAPLLIDVLVGDDLVARSYVAIKEQTARGIGFDFELVAVSGNTSTEALLEVIQNLRQKNNLCGAIIQLPLPAHLDRDKILDAVEPRLDVDCLGAVNSQNFYGGQPYLVPPTAAAVLRILDSIPVALAGKNILIIGRGRLVGQPVAKLLGDRGLRVNIADRATADLAQTAKTADIIISGAGQPRLITGAMIKSGAIIIDAGTAEWESSIVGDVDAESVAGQAAYLSPVPGGVGPVTVAMLLSNVLQVAKQAGPR